MNFVIFFSFLFHQILFISWSEWEVYPGSSGFFRSYFFTLSFKIWLFLKLNFVFFIYVFSSIGLSCPHDISCGFWYTLNKKKIVIRSFSYFFFPSSQARLEFLIKYEKWNNKKLSFLIIFIIYQITFIRFEINDLYLSNIINHDKR
jgi:hypothetical protein